MQTRIEYCKAICKRTRILSIGCLLLINRKMIANSTQSSQAVSLPSTNWAQRCLTSVIGRELVFSTWYGRWREFGAYRCLQETSGWYEMLNLVTSIQGRRELSLEKPQACTSSFQAAFLRKESPSYLTTSMQRSTLEGFLKERNTLTGIGGS